MNYIPRYFTILLAIILIVINILYYFSIQDNLITNQEEKIELVALNIKGSVQENQNIESSFNRFLAEDLRKTAIIIQNELPPKAEDVTTEQLADLKEQHRLKGVTLFVQKDDDVVSVKASNEGEVGLSAKKLLSNEWNSMLQQLAANYDVEPIPGYGQALRNFWATPVAQSKTQPDMVTKWGYYNDEKTDYIISLFVERNVLNAYYETAGLEKKLEHITETNPFLLNVSVVNAETLLNEELPPSDADAQSPKPPLFIGGKNQFPTPQDKDMALDALAQNKMQHLRSVSNETAVLKSYFPTDLKTNGQTTEKSLIVVTSDFEKVNTVLFSRIFKNVIYSLSIFFIGLATIMVAVRAVNKKERTISSVQFLYKQHIDSIYEMISEYRHDFNHHMHTISGLAKMGLTTELHAYISHLVKVQEEFNNIVDASIPELSGLIQSKKIQAREKEIEFEHHFEDMENLNIPVEKLTDIVKIIGNILDNAFHAVEESGKKKRAVSIYGRCKNDLLKFSISNNGEKIPDEIINLIFKMGYTTRPNTGGTGVGLASSKKAMERYKGDIEVVSTDDKTTFTVFVPLHKKEMMKSANVKDIRSAGLNAN